MSTTVSNFPQRTINVTLPQGQYYFRIANNATIVSCQAQVLAAPGVSVSVGGIDGITYNPPTDAATGTSTKITYTGQTSKTLRRTFESPVLPHARYEIRVRKTNTPADDKHIQDTYLVDVSEILNSKVTLSSIAVGWFAIKMTDQISGIPNITWPVKGVKVDIYDNNGTVTATQWSDNPADIILDMLIGSRRGALRGKLSIDYPAFVQWREYCASEGLKFNGVFDDMSTLWDSLAQVFRVGRAYPVRVGSKLSVCVDKPTTPVMLFGPGNIMKDSFQINYLPLTDRANEFEVSYYDKDDLNKKKTIRITDPTAAQAGEIQKTAQYDLFGVDNFTQAQKEVWYQLYQNRLTRRIISFDAPVEAIALTIGDVAYIQHDMVDWGVAGRIKTGNTTTSVTLDKNVTIEVGKTYSLLVLHDKLSKATCSFTHVAGNTYNLTGLSSTSNSIDTLKRFVTNTGDEAAILDFDYTTGTNATVTLDTTVTGTTATIWDVDVIEERTVTTAASTTDTITVSAAFGQIPAKYANYMFGESTSVKRPYRLRSITGDGIEKRTLTFGEYNAAVYAAPESTIPAPVAKPPKTPNNAKNLQFITDMARTSDSVVHGMLTWTSDNVFRYGGADIYTAIGATGQFNFYKTVLTTNACQIDVHQGEQLRFKVVAFNDLGIRAPINTAPIISYNVVTATGSTTAPTTGTSTTDRVAFLATQTINWTRNTDATLATRVQLQLAGETAWRDYGVTQEAHYTFYEIPAGNHTARVRSEKGTSVYSDWLNVPFTVAVPTIVAPTIANDGTAVDHVINTDGSADISFEWLWAGTQSDIDGFHVLVYSSTSSAAYTIGTTPTAESLNVLSSDKRALIMQGVAADKYYTFYVRAYKRVHNSFASTGMLYSAAVKSTFAGENPYQPSSSVAFNGSIIGTINVTDINKWSAITGTGKPSDGASTNLTLVAQGTEAANVLIQGNTYTRTQPADNANWAVVSKESYTGGAAISFQRYRRDGWAGNIYNIVGFTTNNSSVSSSTMVYGVHVYANSFVYSIINGVSTGPISGVVPTETDTFTVTYDGLNGRIYRNGVVIDTTPLTENQTYYLLGSGSNGGCKSVSFTPFTQNNWSALGGTGRPADNATYSDNLIADNQFLSINGSASQWVLTNTTLQTSTVAGDPPKFLRLTLTGGTSQAAPNQLASAIASGIPVGSFPISPNEKLYFACLARSNTVSTNSVTYAIRYYDAAGTLILVDDISVAIGSTSWVGLPVQRKIAPPNAIAVQVLLRAIISSGSVDIALPRVALTENGATFGADWSSNLTNVPANLASLVGTEAILNQTLLNSIAADEILSVSEKLGPLKRLYLDLESRYTDLSNRATALGLSTTALSTARTNWQTLLNSYGQEFVTNGTFTTDTSGWAASNGATLSSVSGRLRVAAPGAVFGPSAVQTINNLVVGQTYILSASLFAGTASNQQIRVGTTSGGTQYGSSTSLTPSITFTATQTTAYIVVIINATTAAATYIEADDISLKKSPAQVAWNDKSADTTIYTHAFPDRNFPANWSLSAATTTTNGIYTTLTDATTAFGSINRVIAQTAQVTQYSFAIFVKKDSVPKTTRYMILRLSFTGGTAKSVDVQLDTSTGEIGNNVSSAADAYGVFDLGVEWLIWGTATSNVDNTGVQLTIFPAVGNTSALNAYNANVTGSVDIRSPLLALGDSTNLGRGALEGRLAAYSGSMTSLAKAISEKQPVFRGAWVTATAYAVNDVVTSNNTLYICVVAHTSAGGPPNANWTKYTPSNQDDLSDGTTYGRPLLSRLNAGKPWIDFSEAIHTNKNVDNINDGSLYGRALLTRLSAGKPFIDFSEGIHLNKSLANVDSAQNTKLTGIAYKATRSDNLISNGELAIDASTWALSGGNTVAWQAGVAGDSVPGFIRASYDGTGNRLAVADSSTTNVSTQYPVQAGETFYISYKQRSSNSTSNVRPRPVYYGPDGTFIANGNIAYLKNTTNNTWETISCIETVPAGASYMRFYLEWISTAGGVVGDTVDWGLVRLARTQLGATWGADWGNNLASRPTELTDGRVAAGLSATNGYIDFSRTHISKTVDSIPDGSTYGRPLLTRLSAGKPLIDFSEAIHTNKNVDNIADGTTYARIKSSELSTGVHKLTVVGSGMTVGDARNLQPISSAGLRYKFTGSISYTSTTTTATISTTAGSVLLGSQTISYNAMSANVSGSGTVTYYLYVDTNAYTAGAHTLLTTTSTTVPYQADSRVYIGSVSVTYTTSGSGSGDPGSGGTSCPWAEAFVHADRGWVKAKDIVAGDFILALADDRESASQWVEVESNEFSNENCFEIIGNISGVKVTVSESTPITLRDGSVITVVEINNHELPFEGNGRFWWEECDIIEVGSRPVCKIKCHQKTYSAGDREGFGILTHNPKP